ncbi:MAG: hypothetical protein K2N90_07400, partial [Lachnospiraceae bacterium]|nr:hypothetical protein [Lachnospiraceae bacterium]
QIISLALVMALVCDQNIANARESMRQNAVSQAVAENTNIENIIQEDNTIIETQDEMSVEPQTEVIFVNEMIDERSENSKQYMMSDKSVTVVMYDNPIHYEDENGNLVEIDNSLIKTQDGYTNGANTYDVVFSDDDATRGKVDFTEGGYGISWQLLEPKENPDLEETEAADGEQSADDGIKAAYVRIAEEESKEAEETSKEAASGEEDTNSEEAADKESTAEEAVKAVAADSEVNDNTDYKDEKEYGYAAKQSSILFDGFTNDVSIEYIPQSDGIKENIIMNTKAPHYVHTFSIRLKGLTASLTEENEVVFYDIETGEPQYYFPAPFMVDDRGNISYDVTYRIESEESSTEENSVEESSTEQSNSEEGSHEEASSQEKEASEESTAEKTTKEEASGETETQIFTEAAEETETEETTVEEIEESETEMPPTLLNSTVSDAYTEIKGVTLSGNAETPKEEYIKESKTDQETETTREEASSIIISEPESESKQEEASEREAEPEHEASSEPENMSEYEMASDPNSESQTQH